MVVAIFVFYTSWVCNFAAQFSYCRESFSANFQLEIRSNNNGSPSWSIPIIGFFFFFFSNLVHREQICKTCFKPAFCCLQLKFDVSFCVCFYFWVETNKIPMQKFLRKVFLFFFAISCAFQNVWFFSFDFHSNIEHSFCRWILFI